MPSRYATAARNEEGDHEPLVRSLAAAGDRAAAERQIAVCQGMVRRELGIEARRRRMNYSDLADYSAAIACLDESVERARRCGD